MVLQGENETTYQDLLQAMAIVANARYQIAKDPPGVESPAWAKLYRIGAYLAKQANSAMEGEPL